MARLLTVGFELNSLAIELDAASSASVVTSPSHGGTYAMQVASTSATRRGAAIAWATATGNGPFWARTYFYCSAFPTAEMKFFELAIGAALNTTQEASVSIDASGALRLYNSVGVVGSPSSAISLNTWYRLEIHFDRTPAAGSQKVDAQLATGEGTAVSFASTTTATLGAGIRGVVLGTNLGAEATTAGIINFDDVAVNDNTGSSQTSFPGAGFVIHLWPNAAGDDNLWTPNSGTGANSYQMVGTTSDKPTPDGATTIITDNTLNNESLFNCEDTPVGMNSYDVINVVHVCSYSAGVAASANSSFKLEIEASSGGTIAQGSAITPTSASYGVNGFLTAAALRVSTLTLYLQPDGVTLWKKASLDTTEIGVKTSAINTNGSDVSTVWLVVDYTTGTPPAPGTAKTLALTGAGA